jgi:hypothetical protein
MASPEQHQELTQRLVQVIAELTTRLNFTTQEFSRVSQEQAVLMDLSRNPQSRPADAQRKRKVVIENKVRLLPLLRYHDCAR